MIKITLPRRCLLACESVSRSSLDCRPVVLLKLTHLLCTTVTPAWNEGLGAAENRIPSAGAHMPVGEAGSSSWNGHSQGVIISDRGDLEMHSRRGGMLGARLL